MIGGIWNPARLRMRPRNKHGWFYVLKRGHSNASIRTVGALVCRLKLAIVDLLGSMLHRADEAAYDLSQRGANAGKEL